MYSQTNYNTFFDLIKIFPDEKACHQYLAGQRWSDGEIVCPHTDCGHNQCYVFSDGIRYKCKKCKILFTAKTKTFMESSKLSTIKWLYAITMILHKKGISSIQLAKDIGVTQKTAWFMLQRIRLSMGNDKEYKLDGIVEIDETFVGGKARYKHKSKRLKHNPGRGWADKTPVMGLLQRGGKVKAFVIPNVLMLTLKKAVEAHVVFGAEIMSDGYTGYRSVGINYKIHSVDHKRGKYVDGDKHTNTIEGFWSQFKKGITGIYHKTTPKHLQKYVDEFAFKYNCRNLALQQQIECLIGNMVCRIKYKELMA